MFLEPDNTYLKVSSISVTLVSFSTTKKLGLRFLFNSPTPPSRNPVHVSSSPITAISLPRPAMVAFECPGYYNIQKLTANVLWFLELFSWKASQSQLTVLLPLFSLPRDYFTAQAQFGIWQYSHVIAVEMCAPIEKMAKNSIMVVFFGGILIAV